MQKRKLWGCTLLFLTISSFAEFPLTIEITNTGWVTPLYTSAYVTSIPTLFNRSFLYTELSPQMSKEYYVIVDRSRPPPPEKLEIHFYDTPDLQGEPVAKWGYFEMENPTTGKWESKLCDFFVDSYVNCFYTGDQKKGYYIYITVNGDQVRRTP